MLDFCYQSLRALFMAGNVASLAKHSSPYFKRWTPNSKNRDSAHQPVLKAPQPKKSRYKKNQEKTIQNFKNINTLMLAGIHGCNAYLLLQGAPLTNPMNLITFGFNLYEGYKVYQDHTKAATDSVPKCQSPSLKRRVHI